MSDENQQSPLQSASQERGRIDNTPDLPTDETIHDIVNAPEPAETRRARLLDAKSKLQASLSANPAQYSSLIESADGETGTRPPSDVDTSGRG